ncbi:MAG: SDR family oxidoreductase [Clostridiales Family XIII bacterium]|jgi:NAD(P)-dependent dehydrogenase (short-subunit alcohol dehydrogenase family)|nr:SDR family oxidoreductase [Clostridiales Family XIII bacterium]
MIETGKGGEGLRRGRVEGKVAVITGGTMGMGFGSACALAREGAHVTVIGRSDAGLAAADELRKYDESAEFVRMDVSDAKGMKAVYDEVAAKYGKIDIAVNAAGVGRQMRFTDVDEDFLDMYLNINFKGMWNACHAAIPHMVKRNYGKIVNFSSVTGVMVADPGMTAYSSTKGAIMGMTKALASEFAANNITVNAILPGMVDTPMARRGFAESDPVNPDAIAEAIAAQIPMKRMGTIEEAGAVALFLSCDDSAYVTGIGLVFDGGSTLPETPGSGWEPA